MSDERRPTPIEIAESPWEDPDVGLLEGAYRRRAVGDPGGPDHAVAYIRAMDGTELFRAETAACGVAVAEVPADRFDAPCHDCTDRFGKVVLAALAALGYGVFP